MHDINDPRNIIDSRIATSNETLGKQCGTCLRLLAYSFFEQDSSRRDGRRDRCVDCESQPWLSTSEHLSRMEEMNFNSEAVKKQRFRHQLDYMDDESRKGRRLHSSEFINKLYKMIGRDKLFITDGNFIGDVSLYKISGVRRPDFDGPRGDFKYTMYLSLGWMDEFGLYEFDKRAVPIREKGRSWRTVLLRSIKSGLATEDQVDWEFGKASGIGSTVYLRTLYEHRNKMLSQS